MKKIIKIIYYLLLFNLLFYYNFGQLLKRERNRREREKEKGTKLLKQQIHFFRKS